MIASSNGELSDKEQARIRRIRKGLEELPASTVLTPAMLLVLAFDIAIADGRIDQVEESYLSELAAASDWLGVTLSSLRAAWAAKSSYSDLVRRTGLYNNIQRYSIGHAATDICTALRRKGATKIRIHTSSVLPSVGITGTMEQSLGVSASAELLGLGDHPTRDGLLTRSTAAIELHIAAAGNLVSDSTTVVSVHGEHTAVAASFGRVPSPRVASISGLEWAGRLATEDGSTLCVLLEGVQDCAGAVFIVGGQVIALEGELSCGSITSERHMRAQTRFGGTLGRPGSRDGLLSPVAA